MPATLLKNLVYSGVVYGLVASQAVMAEPRQLSEYAWEGVDRIVAVGDLHGDYENYLETLQLAGLVNRRGRWAGGTAHLVQAGDIPDRGPDTRKIMGHLDELAEQAEKDGGRVHRLLGNHEAMNAYGDLRYVTPEEFEEFETRNSQALRDRYYELVMQDLQKNDPEAAAALPENHREEWESKHPPGFVEHQQAWNPAWNPEGEYALRTQQLKTAVKINDTIFVHGGISDLYADRSLEALNDEVTAAIRNFDYQNPGIVEDQCGPLWYRGLSGEAPEASPETVTSILERLSAARIVVGHTPTPAVIWPRYDARVVQIDTGISKAYGGYPAYLEITNEGLSAGYPGGKVPLPDTDAERAAYLDAVIALDPANSGAKRFRQGLQSAAKEEGVTDPGDGAAETAGQEQPETPQPSPCLRETPAENAAAESPPAR